MSDLPPGTCAMIAAERLDGAVIRSLTAEFSRRGTVHHTETQQFSTATGEVTAVRWSVSMADYDDPSGTDWLESLLETAAEQMPESGDEGPTTTILAADQRPETSSMLIMDVDSTLIDQEVIDLLAAHAGRAEEVAAVTERAMRGELDFTGSLHARVAALGGLPEAVLAETFEQVTPTAGAEDLIEAFRRRRWPVYAVSGGFRQILQPLAEKLGLTGYDANTLELKDGNLTGSVTGEVVNRAVKEQRLRQWAAEHGITADQVVAVGDGANDLDMVTAAGIGVAFCAKPALAQKADLVIKHRSMELISYALGVSPTAA